MSDPPYLPTPKKIAAMCRAIQADWTDEERIIRASGMHGDPDRVRALDLRKGLSPWEVPIVKFHNPNPNEKAHK